MIKFIKDENNFNENNLNKKVELKIKNIQFPDEKEAIEYLEDMVNENRSIGVKYLTPIHSFEESEKYNEFLEKKKQLNLEIFNFYDFIIKRFEKQKSSKKGCKNCESSLNKEFIFKTIQENLNIINNENIFQNNTDIVKEIAEKKSNIIQCPICKDENFIQLEADKEKFNKIFDKLKDLDIKINEEKSQFEKKIEKKVIFIIGEFISDNKENSIK